MKQIMNLTGNSYVPQLTTVELIALLEVEAGQLFRWVEEEKLVPPLMHFGRYIRWPIDRVIPCLENGLLEGVDLEEVANKLGLSDV